MTFQSDDSRNKISQAEFKLVDWMILFKSIIKLPLELKFLIKRCPFTVFFPYFSLFLASHSHHNCKFLASEPCSSLQMVYIAMKLRSSYCTFNRHKLESGNLRQPNMLRQSFLKSPMVSLEGTIAF